MPRGTVWLHALMSVWGREREQSALRGHRRGGADAVLWCSNVGSWRRYPTGGAAGEAWEVAGTASRLFRDGVGLAVSGNMLSQPPWS